MVVAVTGLSSRAGYILSHFLSPIVLLNKPKLEDQSTEEVLSQPEYAAEEESKSGLKSTMVGSLDMKACYPSLNQIQSANIVEDIIRGSSVEVTGIDYRAVQTCIASNMDQEHVTKEGLDNVLPKRIKTRGRRPGPTTW